MSRQQSLASTLLSHAVLPFVLLAIASCGNRTGGEAAGGASAVNIGAIWEQTGQVAQFGEEANLACRMAVDEYNEVAKAGMPRINLNTQDTQSTPQGAASAFVALTARGRPVAIVGPLTSAAALTVAPLAERNGIVLVNTGSAPDITNAGAYIFRIYPSDAYEAREMVRYILAARPERIVTIVYPMNEYGTGLFNEFSAAAQSTAIATSGITYPPDQVDFRVIAAKVLAGNPDAAYLPGYPATVAPLARALRDGGFQGQIFSSLGIDDPAMFELAGNASDGIIYTVTALPDADDNPLRAQFEARFRAKYGREPGFPALYGYDVAKIVVDAIGAGARTSADLQRAFGAGARFEGVTGAFEFDENGDVKRPYAIRRLDLKQKALVPVTQ